MAEDWGRRQQAARERWHEASDGKRYLLRRPTELEFRRLARDSSIDVGEELALRFVVGWSLTDADLAPGVGGEERVPFSREAWAEYVGDRLALLVECSNQIWSDYQARQRERAAVEGKSTST